MAATVRIPVNLATTPFRRDRAILIGSAATAVLLIAVLVLQIYVIFQEREAATEERQLIARLEGQLRQLNAEHAKQDSILRQPANAAVLERSLFLNSLLQRKAISWTRMFDDLGAVMPHNVRLVSVRPFVTGDNRIQLDMILGAASPEPVIEFLKRLEGSALFGATEVQSWQPPSQNEPLYRYRVSASYAQSL